MYVPIILVKFHLSYILLTNKVLEAFKSETWVWCLPLVLHRRVSNDPLLMRFIFYCFRISRPERNQLSTLNNKTLGVSMVNKSRHGDYSYPHRITPHLFPRGTRLSGVWYLVDGEGINSRIIVSIRSGLFLLEVTILCTDYYVLPYNNHA